LAGINALRSGCVTPPAAATMARVNRVDDVKRILANIDAHGGSGRD
jgi:hypothetical protein